ncbi:MAG: MerR family transcriptional regulator [bacterium]|nr:MerR family transcriptional regulator [bacterium]
MKYKVGEVAHLLGLTTAAIHYYEKEGVIQTKKEANGHRYYEIEDLIKLIQCKETRNREIPLKEITGALQNTAYNSRMFIGNHIRNKRMLEEKIDLYQHLVSDLDQYIGQLCKMDSMVGEYEIISCDPTWINVDPEGNLISKNSLNNEVLKQWVNHLPFTKLAVVFDFAHQEKGQPKVALGLSASEEEAKRLRLPQGNNVIVIERVLCLHTVIVSNSFFEDKNYGLEPVFSYLETRGLETAGNAHGVILFHDNDNQVTKTYIELWIPIKEK